MAWFAALKYWKYITMGLLAALAGWFYLEWRAAEAEADREQAAHEQTIANYRAAQAEAARQNIENVRKAEYQQQEISRNVEADYTARLAELRARYDRLRRNAASGSTASATDLPSLPDAASGSDGDANARFSLTVGERLTAAEYALRLEALQQWVRRQAEMD
jgi:lysozyme family protein